MLSRYDEFLRQCSPYFLTVRKPEERRSEDLSVLVAKCIDNEVKRQRFQAGGRPQNKRRKR